MVALSVSVGKMSMECTFQSVKFTADTFGSRSIVTALPHSQLLPNLSLACVETHHWEFARHQGFLQLFPWEHSTDPRGSTGNLTAVFTTEVLYSGAAAPCQAQPLHRPLSRGYVLLRAGSVKHHQRREGGRG